MPKLFSDRHDINPSKEYTFTGEDVFYLQRSLRMRPGELLTLGTADGRDFEGKILRMTADSVVVEWMSERPNQAEPPYQAILYQGLLKGEKMDWLIQKAVELGVDRIVPMISERTIARPEAKDQARKSERWNKIALEAARQCGRGRVPHVEPILSFPEAVCAAREHDISFLPWEGERGNLLRSFMEGKSLPSCNDTIHRPSVSFFIGPEGGFSESEAELVRAAGIATVSLGSRILRAETAGLAVLSILSYRFEI